MTDEALADDTGDATTRVHVVLVLRVGERILAASAEPGAALELPSHELREGQSIAAAAGAIIAEILDRKPSGAELAGLRLGARPDAADALELYVVAKLDPTTLEPGKGPREPWGLHPEVRSTWSDAAARALEAARGAFTIVDLDGASLPIATLDVPTAASFRAAPPARRETVVLTAALAGGMAWTSGAVWALAAAEILPHAIAMVLWITSLMAVFGFVAHGRAAGKVALGFMLALPSGFLLLVLSLSFGGADAPHAAFWLWAFGALSVAAALRRLHPPTEGEDRERVRRRLAWAAVTFVSLVAVLPPLRDALFKPSATSTTDEPTPTPRAPSDD